MDELVKLRKCFMYRQIYIKFAINLQYEFKIVLENIVTSKSEAESVLIQRVLIKIKVYTLI